MDGRKGSGHPPPGSCAGKSGAQFDGLDAGWLVYGPGSAHSPTVTRGRAFILYLLPQGAIELTKS